MRYYLGPYIRRATDHDGPAERWWSPPDGVLAAIDMRPIPAQASEASVPGPAVGLFATPDAIGLGADYRLIGSGGALADIVPPERDRAVLASAFGVRRVDGTTLAEWMYSALTVHADPTGETAVRPLMPTRRGMLEACGVRRRFRLDLPEALPVIATLQAEYRALRQAARDGQLGAVRRGGGAARFEPDPEFHRRVLDGWGEKFGLANPQDVCIPSDLPRETRLPHATTITESFNKSNSTTLGPDLTWAELENNLEVYSSQCRQVNTFVTASARADSDLSSSDHYAQIDTVNQAAYNGMSSGVIARKDSTSTATYYLYRLYYSDGTTFALQAFKVISGTATQLGSNYVLGASISNPDTVRVQCDGSTISGQHNGTERHSVTDTAISGNTRCGVRLSDHAINTAVDDFEAGDLAAASASLPPIPMMMMPLLAM
ncbi:MAG: hypothetical protein IT529_06180 [Burkholderiales bacterium]|nr:hypothetical protein [Burkholderiales bacterium]